MQNIFSKLYMQKFEPTISCRISTITRKNKKGMNWLFSLLSFKIRTEFFYLKIINNNKSELFKKVFEKEKPYKNYCPEDLENFEKLHFSNDFSFIHFFNTVKIASCIVTFFFDIENYENIYFYSMDSRLTEY